MEEVSPIFGVPDWIGRLARCDSELIQSAELRFVNGDFARVELKLMAESSAELKQELESKTFYLMEKKHEHAAE